MSVSREMRGPRSRREPREGHGTVAVPSARVREPGHRASSPGPEGWRRGVVLLAFVAVAASGCAARGAPIQLPEARELAREASAASTRESRVRAVFAWSMAEADARFSGDGVAHIGTDDRARIDLFGPRGDGYLSAILVGDVLALPPGAPADAPVPPPALLWSTVGVFRPPSGAELVASRRSGARVVLEYAGAEGTWRFTFEGDRLVGAELDGLRGRQSVELRGLGPGRLPERAVYRDHTAFRELVLTLVDAEDPAEFPPDIWSLSASGP